MNEAIVSIKEFEEERGEGWTYNDPAPESGYEVTTTEQVIRLAIHNEQDCCESWGYLWSNEKPEDFVGATLLDIQVVGESMNKEQFNIIEEEYGEATNCMFINLDTDRGTLQFIAYNQHNGYYSHMARVSSKQFSHHDRL